MVALAWDLITPFIACLSTERDQLSQWRGYARGGYSIRFNSRALQSSMRQVDKDGNVVKLEMEPFLMKVLYVADDFRDEIRDVVRSTIEARYAQKLGSDGGQAGTIGAIFVHGSRLKNRKFYEESEYRIIIDCRETFRTPSVLGFTPRTALSFDSSAIRQGSGVVD